MKKSDASKGQSTPGLVSKRIADLGDWRGKTLSRMRKLIQESVPGVVEELKWGGTPVWSHHGILCTGESYKSFVKLTFAKGAALADPARLFNSSLEGNTRRAIDIHEDEDVDARAFKALIRAAAALNASLKKPTAAKPKSKAATSRSSIAGKGTARKAAGAPPRNPAAVPVLLSGGNPQIAKGDGDAPVKAYIKAMPGWKRDVGRKLDELIERTVPEVRKAVKWNSPFYGVEGQGWFLDFHCFAKYVKLAFFRGTSLRPVPPGESKVKDVRYLDIHEDDKIDEKLLASWIRQAASMPGWDGGSPRSGGAPS